MTASTTAPSAQDLENEGENEKGTLGPRLDPLCATCEEGGKGRGHWSSWVDLKIHAVLGLDILTSNLQAKSLEGLLANPRYSFKHPGSLWREKLTE